MKKIIAVVSVALFALLACDIADAQSKIGYINFDQLVQQMPEVKTIKKQIDDYSNQFIDQLTAMNNELQSKSKDYEKDRAAMTDAARTAKEGELTDLQKRIQSFENEAQQKVTAKTNELSKPLLDKVRTAVAQVAKEKGYAYVFNSSQTDLIVSPPGDDLMNEVKAKLGLK